MKSLVSGRPRLLVALLSALVIAIGLAACGGGSDTGNSAATEESTTPAEEGSSTTASSGEGSGFAEEAAKLYEEGTAEQTAMPPSSGPKAVPGKKVVVIPCAMAAEGCARPARGAVEAAKEIGWQVQLIDPQADPKKIVDAVETAISSGADGIMMEAIDESAIAQPLAAAKKAGIVVSSFAAEGSGFDYLLPSEKGLEEDGYLSGAVSFHLSEDELKLIKMEENFFGSDKLRENGLNEFLSSCEAAGESCELLGSQNFQVPDMATQGPSQAAALARSNPTYNVLWGPFDASVTFFSQGINQAGLAGEAFAIGFDANSANVEEIREEGFQKATIGLPLGWVGWAQVDALNRIFAGQEPVDSGIHSKVLTKENLPPEGAWDGDVEYKPSYLKVWGK